MNDNQNNNINEQRNELDFNVETSAFNGPFELLYNLIRERKMDIMNINLAELIQQYVNFINKHFNSLKIDDLTEYLLMATYLLEQKSKKILPAMDTEEKVDKDIERDKFIQRLLVYKQYQNIVPKLVEKMERRQRMFERTEVVEDKSIYFEKPSEGDFLPTMDLDKILKAMQKIYMKLQYKEKLKELGIKGVKTSKSNIKIIEVDEVSIDDVEKEILAFLEPYNHLDKISFMEYFESIPIERFTKQYFAVSFVAILVLVRNQHIMLEQNNSDEEIFIVKINKEVVTDEY